MGQFHHWRSWTLFVSLVILLTSAPARSDDAQGKSERVAALLTKIDTGDTERDLENVQDIILEDSDLVVPALVARFSIELDRVKAKEDLPVERPSQKILYGLLNALQQTADPSEVAALRDLAFQMHQTIKNRDPELLEALTYQFDGLIRFTKNSPVRHLRPTRSARTRAKRRTAAFRHVPELSPLVLPEEVISDVVSQEGLEKHFTEFRAELEKRIIGQPHVIERLLLIERRRLLYGRRTGPELVFLMGLPGTGKDTTAHAYAEAIHRHSPGPAAKHFYELPVCKTEADFWNLLGSATGFIGSNNFPEFLRFLVDHSGGRYLIEPVEGSTRNELKVVENPEWKGYNLDGFMGPESAVVFVNEFHDWSREAKNSFLKKFVETGYVKINNPNGGVAALSTGVTVVIATNDGMELMSPREPDGRRFGAPLSAAQMIEKWETVRDDIPLLRQRIIGEAELSTEAPGRMARGTSPEVVSRIPDRAFLLMKPLLPPELQQILRLKFQEMTTQIQQGRGLYGPMEFVPTDDLIRFLQEYHYIADENGRPVADRMVNLIERTTLEALAAGQLKASSTNQVIALDVRQNSDETWNLDFTVQRSDPGETYQFSRPMVATLQDRKPEPLSDERVKELLALPGRLTKRVFGIEHIAERLGAVVLDMEEARSISRGSDTPVAPARSFMFLGLSSTGKTQLAKELDAALNPGESRLVVTDCTQVQTITDIKHRVLGSRDALGRPIPSEFMKHYDRLNGRLTLVLDEVANAPLETLKALYDIFREPVVTTFSDGRPRRMDQVTIILTGNAGEEWFRGIPHHLPEMIQQEAMREIYQHMMQNPYRRRHLLTKYFSEAFLNRIGEQNIFFFGPLSFQSIRELTQLKVNDYLAILGKDNGRRFWPVTFKDSAAYAVILSAFEEAGFILKEQGASIDRFVRQDFVERLRHTLLTEKIASGRRIVIDADEPLVTDEPYGSARVPTIHLRLHIEGQKEPLKFFIRGKQKPSFPNNRQMDRILTAYHEAGHEIVRHVYFHDTAQHEMISIIPGVTEIANDWVVYEGIARSRTQTHVAMTREVALRRMAILFGGEVAQSLVTKGARTDAGKSNDLERATNLAYHAILSWGLSPNWGNQTFPENKVLSELPQILAGLTEADRHRLDREVKVWLKEARELAQHALLVNLESGLFPLGSLLAEKGVLHKADLDAFYDQDLIIKESDPNFRNRLNTWTGAALKSRLSPWVYRRLSRDGELLPHVPVPEKVAETTTLIAAKKAEGITKVQPRPDAPIWDGSGEFPSLTDGSAGQPMGCAGLLTLAGSAE